MTTSFDAHISHLERMDALLSTRRALSHCRECGCLTNHTTLEHEEADELRDEKRDATSQYDGDYNDEGGEA